MILKRKEVTVKETTIKETVIHSDISEDLSDFSRDISKLFVEEMKGQPLKQADLHTRKSIWSILYEICFIGFAFAEFSDTPFGQFIFDLLIEII